MEDTIARETRALLKERTDYRTFRHQAERVGITAIGVPDANELYHNANMPVGMKPEDTCLELCRRFQENPGAFALETHNE